ncbi:hypothetical protein GE061_020233 [Apolygus lucorum]|uniref:Uncharacterized protein n=1 Tax=Apolygus lucorum TaxID=248454 RepID=A0A8S9WI54_APOLU|nr:hypothetical protein GE061_020233 [Apolygus lucorum]
MRDTLLSKAMTGHRPGIRSSPSPKTCGHSIFTPLLSSNGMPTAQALWEHERRIIVHELQLFGVMVR